MLPTPETSHVSFDRVYEPAEDSFLLIDTLSSESERQWLSTTFDAGRGPSSQSSPLAVEVGTGSGVVLAFLTREQETIIGRTDLLTLGIDISSFACQATSKTVQLAIREGPHEKQSSRYSRTGAFLDAINADLTTPLRSGTVDILVFNPPYVPTAELPDLAKHQLYNSPSPDTKTTFEQDSHLLELSYAGGIDGMEITNRLLEQIPHILHPVRGVAYVLLCAQNKPLEVKACIQDWGNGWSSETVGFSGKQAGWEKLQILRIWRRTED
ncbi:hypothetical protein K490DRAFT_66084 [Saccharata proteae CBS 121410]|uniref:Methyltransferase n=1 Tax=Saccharata proteae CBS 121410 TaxID=1314787 RepID=A0A9P4HSK0_9PEZI|nr:hypothetical protein K490DRAFT_66084 [Saccharata proteae CBS 121410]